MSYRSHPVGDLLDAVAAEKVTPAGGTVAAIVGASGAALCEMVCIHTSPPSTPQDTTRELSSIREQLDAERQQLLDLADADADAVETMLRTRHADGTDTQMKPATGVPLAIAETCLAILEHAEVIVEHGNPNAVPDAITGVYLTHAALTAALFTVHTNLERIDEDSFTTEVARRTTDIEKTATTTFDRIVDSR